MKLIKMTSVMLTLALTLGACSNSSTNEQNSAQGGENSKNEAKAALNNKTFTVKGVKFTMVPVEGGNFMMGATGKMVDNAESDEFPTHNVTLSTYYIGQTEVTQELWTVVMGYNPSNFQGAYLPVEQVTWVDCQKFIAKLNELTGENFRLPTEAEWEFAARGGNKSKGYKFSGSDNVDEVAWNIENSGDMTHSVATKKPNELGIYDMSGSLDEWCADIFGTYDSSAQTDPKGPSNGEQRVNRGSSFKHEAERCRLSNRDYSKPELFYVSVGFRLAL